MATQEQVDNEKNEFAQAFDSPDPDTQEPTEDEAFGITPDVSAEDTSGNGEPPAVTVDNPAGDSGDQPVGGDAPDQGGDQPTDGGEANGDEGSPAEEAAETPAQEAAEQAAGTDDQPSQQEKSWEGRLRKRQEELDQREADLKAREEALNSGNNNEGGEDAGDDSNIGDGGMSADEAVAKLSEDFGEDFVNMIVAIATAKAKEAAAAVAGESVSGTSNRVDAIISHLQNKAARDHFTAIKAAHPDFQEVNAAPEFQAFIMAMPDDERSDAQRVLSSGNTDEVINLLSAYKNSMQQGENGNTGSAGPDEDPGVDDAEGVRSVGITLPEVPPASDDYADAWERA